MDPRLMIGQRLAVGFDGPTIPQDFVDLVREYKVGNVILFRRNVQSFEQLRALCADIRALIVRETGIEPYIMIDEECGRVSRLEHIAVKTPCALAIGATDDPENARKIGRLIGEELRAAGVNFNLAPVLDCLTHPEAAGGNRSFATE
ncbi:MAG: glycoside hydrolase family 3 protein, partial [Clostridia bacterium]|nr:glycoside hydrolase family 3 protein [Clostridia bacterium]